MMTTDPMAAARARVAARVAAAGGIDAYRAGFAELQRAADAKRAADVEASAAERARKLAERAALSARIAEETAAGRWVTYAPEAAAPIAAVTDTYAEAEAAAESSRRAGIGATVYRAGCGHGVNRLAARWCPTCKRIDDTV